MKKIPFVVSMCRECPYFEPDKSIGGAGNVGSLAYCRFKLVDGQYVTPIYNKYEILVDCPLEDEL